LGPGAGLHFLHTIDDTHALVDSIVQKRAGSAVVVGVGLEMAEALTIRGVAVTVLEQFDQVRPTLDAELAGPLAEHLRANGVAVQHGTKVLAITRDDDRLRVDTEAGTQQGDVVLVVAGVQPDTTLVDLVAAGTGLRDQAAGTRATTRLLWPAPPTITRPTTRARRRSGPDHLGLSHRPAARRAAVG
jgi:pyruvate/2-oxoglutarate dehydrogenase complex dihydrolipoamide dehydrogenase (E3) component